MHPIITTKYTISCTVTNLQIFTSKLLTNWAKHKTCKEL